ncbi:MAG: hypothetical protein HY088_07905 [Ignavibacteriales bacterium]|nr:hypothetical protein [Ignavibacteriales bacterium]
MKHLTLFLGILSLVVLSASCEKYPTEPEPLIPPKDVLRNIQLKQIDYNVVQIQSTDELILSSQSVKHIGAGIDVGGDYKELTSTDPTYTKLSSRYSLKFNFTMPLDSTKTMIPFILRYYFTNGEHADIEQDLPTFKYPFTSAVPYVYNSILINNNPFFQDVDRIENTLFYHPLGADGLYSYDLITKQTKRLVMYGAGDHIACAASFVFYDDDHRTVKRYNLSTQTTDLVIPYFKDLQNDLNGMAAADGMLYVLVKKRGINSILKFDYEGNLLGTIPFPRSSYYLAAHNGILYSLDYAEKRLVRFNVQTKTFLPSKPMAAPLGDGIKIYGNQLYFVDYYKRFVGIVALSEIEDEQPEN